MERTGRSVGYGFGILAALALALFSLAGPAVADNGNTGLRVVQLAGQIQSGLQLAVIEAFGDILLFNPQSAKVFAQKLSDFDQDAKEIKIVLGVGKPGREKLSKYYNRLFTIKSRLEKRHGTLKQVFDQTGDIDKPAFRAFKKEADRIRYQISQFVRHLINYIDVTKFTPDQRIKYAMAILTIQMQGDLFHAVIETMEDNISQETGQWTTFWSDLGRFDVHAAVLGSLMGAHQPTPSALGADFHKLTRIKHGVVITGEAIFTAFRKRGRPDPLDLKDLTRFAQQAEQTGKSLLAKLIAQ